MVILLMYLLLLFQQKQSLLEEFGIHKSTATPKLPLVDDAPEYYKI